MTSIDRPQDYILTTVDRTTSEVQIQPIMSVPPSVADFYGRRVHYNYDANRWETEHARYHDLHECSHFVYKVTCQNSAYHHWPDDRPYVKENHPKKCTGTRTCPVDGHGISLKRSDFVRPNGNTEFRPPQRWISTARCRKCENMRRKKAGEDTGGGQPSRKRPGDPDQSSGKRSKAAHTVREHGRAF